MEKWLQKNSLFTVLPFIQPYRRWLLLILLLLLAISFLTVLPPWLIQHAIDQVLPVGDSTLLLWLGLAILAISLTEGLLSFVQQVLSEWISQRITRDIRNQLFHHLNHLSFSFFDRARVGDLIARVVADTDTLKRFFAFGLLKVITNLFVLAWILFSLTFWSPWLGLLFVFMVPLMIHAMWAYSVRVRPAFGRIRKTTGRLTAFTREHLAGIAMIKLFGNEAESGRLFREENELILNDTLTANRISSYWLPYSEFLLGFFSGLVLLIGFWLISTGRMTTGTLVGFLAYIQLLNRPIRQTGFLLSLFQQSDSAAERITETLRQRRTLGDAPGAVPFLSLTDSFAMDHVSFSYDHQLVLDQVSFRIKPGETIALVGPSGAGKTTLVHLLLRFYEPQEGTIMLDGKPIHHYTLTSMRQKIGLVMQHPFLFNGSIQENIALGEPNTSKTSIESAARSAELHDFIAGLPLGYNTPIGERGVRLSGGQAQRLALARAMLREPEILVLDEPTSSVDHLTDASLMDSVSALMKGKTTLVIAHRLSTLRHAHRILFLENGQVTGQGTHEDLLERHRGYRSFVNASGYIRDEGGEEDAGWIL